MAVDRMKLLFIQEAVYVEFGGNLYSGRIAYEKYWDRYLSNFDNVTVLARVKQSNDIPQGFKRSTGPGINFIPLPFYNGPFDYFTKRKTIKTIIKDAISSHQVIVIRIPGPLGALAQRECVKRKIKYVVEAVGDPYEVGKFLPVPWPLRTYLRFSSFWEMKRMVRKASAVLYVTETVLQKRYPASIDAITSYASNVIISEDAIISDKVPRIRKIKLIGENLRDASKQPVRVGVLGMVYAIKSPLEIVRAAKILIDSGLNIEIYFAGHGPLIPEVERLSADLNIRNNIKCLGPLPGGKSVMNFLDSIDLYLQFSKTEGLPRAMIEAMARGCPVIASNVGGIPELISRDLLVDSSDYVSLSDRIMWLFSNRERMAEEVEKNINKAREFSDHVLSVKRNEFYGKVKKIYEIKNK